MIWRCKRSCGERLWLRLTKVSLMDLSILWIKSRLHLEHLPFAWSHALPSYNGGRVETAGHRPCQGKWAKFCLHDFDHVSSLASCLGAIMEEAKRKGGMCDFGGGSSRVHSDLLESPSWSGRCLDQQQIIDGAHGSQARGKETSFLYNCEHAFWMCGKCFQLQ